MAIGPLKNITLSILTPENIRNDWRPSAFWISNRYTTLFLTCTEPISSSHKNNALCFVLENFVFFCEDTVFPAEALFFIGFCRYRKYFIHLIDSNTYIPRIIFPAPFEYCGHSSQLYPLRSLAQSLVPNPHRVLKWLPLLKMCWVNKRRLLLQRLHRKPFNFLCLDSELMKGEIIM